VPRKGRKTVQVSLYLPNDDPEFAGIHAALATDKLARQVKLREWLLLGYQAAERERLAGHRTRMAEPGHPQPVRVADEPQTSSAVSLALDGGVASVTAPAAKPPRTPELVIATPPAPEVGIPAPGTGLTKERHDGDERLAAGSGRADSNQVVETTKARYRGML